MRRALPPLLLFSLPSTTPLSSLLLPPHLSNPLPLPLSTTTSPPPPNPSASLTQEDLTNINHLIPILCNSNHLLDAVHLLNTSLLASPPPPLPSLPSLPLLVDRLASHPDTAPAFSLLTALAHNPRCPSPLPFCSMLLSSYLQKRRLKEAFKVFQWICRPNSPCRPDLELYQITIEGFCRLERPLEALRALREMVGDRVMPGKELREWVYRSLLREARVCEARELDAALVGIGDDGDGFERVTELIDRIVGNWKD